MGFLPRHLFLPLALIAVAAAADARVMAPPEPWTQSDLPAPWPFEAPPGSPPRTRGRDAELLEWLAGLLQAMPSHSARTDAAPPPAIVPLPSSLQVFAGGLMLLGLAGFVRKRSIRSTERVSD